MATSNTEAVQADPGGTLEATRLLQTDTRDFERVSYSAAKGLDKVSAEKFPARRCGVLILKRDSNGPSLSPQQVQGFLE